MPIFRTDFDVAVSRFEIAGGREARVRIEQHGLLHLVRVVAAAVLVEAAVVDRLVERGAPHHALFKATLSGGETCVGTVAPFVQRVLADGVRHGSLEGARVDDRGETGHVAEAERGGEAGLDALHALLRRIKRDTGADFVIVNGENAAGNGVLPRQAEDIFDAGADVVTLGNHAFGKQQIVPYLDEHSDILRPANLAPQSPGQGWGIFDGPQGSRLLVIDLIGRCDMKYGPDNPFLCVDRILKENEGRYDVALVEFHANATSEKLAMGYYLDGRVSAVWGTHTHVQTADERVNPKGTGYITDLGMTGPYHSVLGVRIEQSIAMFRGDLTEYFKTAPGDCAVSGAVFEIERGGKCVSVERVWKEYKVR